MRFRRVVGDLGECTYVRHALGVAPDDRAFVVEDGGEDLGEQQVRVGLALAGVASQAHQNRGHLLARGVPSGRDEHLSRGGPDVVERRTAGHGALLRAGLNLGTRSP